MFNNSPPRKSCCLWNDVEKYSRSGHTISANIMRRMRTALWVTKAHTLKICNIYLLFHAKMATRTRPNIVFECTIASLVVMWVHWFRLTDISACGTVDMYMLFPLPNTRHILFELQPDGSRVVLYANRHGERSHLSQFPRRTCKFRYADADPTWIAATCRGVTNTEQADSFFFF